MQEVELGEYVADYAYRERDLEGEYSRPGHVITDEKGLTRIRTRVADAVGSSPVPVSLMNRGERSRSRSQVRMASIAEQGGRRGGAGGGVGGAEIELAERGRARERHSSEEESQESTESKTA